MVSIDPQNYGVKEPCRLLVKNDTDNQIVILEHLDLGEKYEIINKEISENLQDYKFLFQRIQGSGFRNITTYNFFFDVKELENYLLEKITVTDEKAYEILSLYWKSNTKLNIVKPIMRKSLEHIWKNRTTNISNIKQMQNLYYHHKSEVSILWRNIISFLNNLVNLYSNLDANNLIGKNDFHDLDLSEASPFKKFINEEIIRLHESDLQLDKFMVGNYYSLLEEREKAGETYNEVKSEYSDFNILKELNLENNGLATYEDAGSTSIAYKREEAFPTFNFFSKDIPENIHSTIVLSMDKTFLKAYGVHTLYTITTFKDIHFHFHIIDEDAVNIIEETLKLFNEIIKFREVENIVTPTFSYEQVPDSVTNEKTYYACARFMHADVFIETFKTEILILDADFYFLDTPDNLLKKCRRHDIAISTSGIGLSVFPWRRLMAGIVYLNDTIEARRYSQIVTGYILDQINNKITWTLDQNALTFGYEKIKEEYPDVNIGNTRVNPTPIAHPKYRGVIESQ